MTHTKNFSTSSFFNALKPLFDEVVSEVEKYENGFYRPQANIIEQDNAYIIQLVVPGHSKDTVKIELKDQLLTIGSHLEKSAEQKYNRREFTIGNFQRSFNLPTKADKDAISASFKDGILSVSIGKKAESQPKTVEIL
jgi:HSP20 family protein